MGKPVDHDATMEMSTSQLVPDQPDHDASVWKQVVVGSDAFAPASPPATTRGNRAALWILLAFLGFAAAAALTVLLTQ